MGRAGRVVDVTNPGQEHGIYSMMESTYKDAKVDGVFGKDT
jgi:hypothetical protein